MYEQEKIKPYDSNGDKGKQVEEMFDSIAPTYDKLNHRLSWNIDKGWRLTAIQALAKHNPQTILDVATGTGDFAILAAKMLRPKKLVGADISEGMMAIGRKKVEQEGLSDTISFKKEDCMSLTFDDNSFDAVTAAFGIRNFPNLDKGLAEMCRVLKPGGQLCVIELTQPTRNPMKTLFGIYSHTILPAWGNIISKNDKAYSYLTATIEAFPQGERMMTILQRAGFSETTFRRLTFGICTLYIATKRKQKKEIYIMDKYGLIGYPLGHSFSISYFNQKFADEGMDAVYENFEIPTIDALTEVIETNPNLRGLNVTIPYKEKVMPFLDVVSPEARAIGAVNVIKVEHQGNNAILKGYNSDVIGFTRSIEPMLEKNHKKALILGTGGASKAIQYGLKSLGLESVFVSRYDRPDTIQYKEVTPEIVKEYNVIVNCTPCGMYPHTEECPELPYEAMDSNTILYDLIYNPDETLFMKNGEKYGATTKNGLEMLLLQAFASWDFWQGK